MSATKQSQFAGLLLILFTLAAACGPAPTPVRTPTAQPTLNVALWVDWPVAQYGFEQRVSVIVSDLHAGRVSGATVRGHLMRPDGPSEPLIFPLTDDEGYTSLPVAIPTAGTAVIEYKVIVGATLNARYGMASTIFEIWP